MEQLQKPIESTNVSRKSGPEDMTQMLESAKKRANEERSLPRVAMKYTPSMLVSMEIFHQREEWRKKETGGDTYDIMQTFLGNETYYSSKPLRSLKPILLRDMHIRQRHEGFYLLCRIICPPTRNVCVTLAVEDAEGWCQIVSLYNFPGTHGVSISELDTIFPSNTVVAIREPYCKMGLATDHSHIRIDSPSDFVILEPGDPLLANIRWSTGNRQPPISSHSGMEWKAIGDKHFKAKEYFAALVAYSYALRRTAASVPLQLNRSLAHLRLGNFAAALRDAQVALESGDISQDERIKALYRSAQAEYGEGHYEDAKNFYLKCLEVSPDLKDPRSGILNCDLRLTEHSEGIYDWMSLFGKSTWESSSVDVAEFIGPIEVAKMKNRGGGRRVQATRDIKPGELLVVAKPFSASSPEELKTRRVFFAFNFITNSVDDEANYMVHQNAIFKAAYQPSALDIYKLYGGENFAPVTESEIPILLDSPLHFATDIDVGRIHAICSLNQFGFGKASGGKPHNRKAIEAGGTNPGSALYLLPSYFNHSCVSNARREHLGDTMVVRALRKIKKGDEVTMSYLGHGATFEEREQVLKHWIQECDCDLCQQDRRTPTRQRSQRVAILEEMSHSDTTTSRMRELIKTLVASYPENYGPYRHEAWKGHHFLAEKLHGAAVKRTMPTQSAYQEAIQHEFDALESLEVHVDDKKMKKSPQSKAGSLPISTEVVPGDYFSGQMTCLAIAAYFVRLNVEWRAERWIAAAIWIHNATFGGGIPLFKQKFGSIMKALYGPIAEKLLERIERSNYPF